MRLAIVFDDLTQMGGAENLLKAVHDHWPDAPIYVSLYSDEIISKLKISKSTFYTSVLNYLPFKKHITKILGALNLHILAYQKFNFDGYDVVLSISARYAHHINTKPRTKHICYFNSPGRMYWEPHLYFKSKYILSVLAFFLSYFRVQDYIAAQRIDKVLANSSTPLNRIKKYYNRDAEIIYPFYEKPENLKFKNTEDYYIMISRLVSWKRVHIAVEAFNRNKRRLIIVGDGPEKKNLEKIAKNNIKFCGYVSDATKFELLSGATALIQTQYEDFGIVPVESMSVGVPVIAYAKGGVLETVTPDKTGVFFYDQTIDSLESALKDFDSKTFNKGYIKQHAKKFTKKQFLENISCKINSVYFN